MNKLLLYFIFITLLITGCCSITSRIDTFTAKIRDNPNFIYEITESDDIIIHDSLKSDILEGIIDLNILTLKVKDFYSSPEIESKSIITNKKVFYRNFWRKNFDITKYDYYDIAYCKLSINKCLTYEFLVRKDTIILFDIYVSYFE